MAWNEPGGGKRRDPWQGNGGGEPDFEQTLKRLKDRFGRFGGGAGGAWLLVAALVAVWFVVDSWTTIDESQRGVVLRFGKLARVMGPGLNFKWPRPVEQVYVVDTTRVRSTSSQAQMLSKDENLLVVDFNVQYTVGDPYQFLFGVREPDETLRQAAESAVRQVIGANRMETVISSERSRLMEDAEKILQDTLNAYGAGIVVTELNFPNLTPPTEVKDAFDDAVAAREDKQRLQNEAEAYAKKVVPEARGDAARIRADAEGDKAAVVADAEGAAARFTMLAEQYRAAPEVTRKRLLLETMQSVLAGSPKVLVEGGGDKVIYLPLDQIGSGPVLPPVGSQPSSPDRVARSVPALESARPREDARRGGREGRDR